MIAGLRRVVQMQARFKATKTGAFDPFANSPRSAPDLPPPSASELWTNSQVKPQPLTHKDTQDSEDIFSHPIYTPPAVPYTGIGPMIGPLKWPELDQSGLLASTNPRVPSPPGPDPYYADFENALEAPIGAYPRITHQFTELKDPFKYWDQQGRRNYGDIVADQELQMNQWSHGPGTDVKPYLKSMGILLGSLGAILFSIRAWDPEQHLWQAERDYPFNGLHLELGADPENLEDTAVTARQHKNQYDSTYKSI